jgi:VWFA-related protein
MHISRRSLLFGSAFGAFAQQPTFTAGVDVVTLLATVRDKDGHVVKDLGREDFVLQEDGRTQTITYFSRESDLPLTIGLLVDTSRSQMGVLERERTASYRFLDQVLREDKDLAFVAKFDVRVEVLQGFTSSRKELAAALDRLSIPGRVATLLYEAIRKTSENQMRKQPGRKAFIVLSDGVSVRDPASIGTAIEYAQRADTIIYSILFADHRGLRLPVRKAANGIAAKRGEKAMQRLARETGGAYFEVTASHPIEKIYGEIEDALRSQYSIGYTPKVAGKSGQYRKIKLTTKKRGLIVQTRDGYYSK